MNTNKKDEMKSEEKRDGDVRPELATAICSGLIDDLTNMIDENIRKGSCETYDEWQAAVEAQVKSTCEEIIQLREALRELLAQVDKRCGGKAEGDSPLVRACDRAREILPNKEIGK